MHHSQLQFLFVAYKVASLAASTDCLPDNNLHQSITDDQIKQILFQLLMQTFYHADNVPAP